VHTVRVQHITKTSLGLPDQKCTNIVATLGYCNSVRGHSLASVLSRQLGTAIPICVPRVEKPSGLCGDYSSEARVLDGRTRSCPKGVCSAGGGGRRMSCVGPLENVVSHAGSEASPLGFLPRDPNGCLRQLGRAEYEKSKPEISQNITSPNGNSC
jgi:hypothetical protein